MARTCIAPSPLADFVELGATRQGRLFRKHILNKGTLHYPKAPGGKVEIDDTFIDTLTRNFDNGVSMVQVPLAGPRNEHSESPDLNIGQVVGIERGTGADIDKVYALIDARKHAEDLGSTLLGASALMSLDYEDTNTGMKVGPTLLHVAVTNRPYVTGLQDYQEVIAASAEYSGDTVMLTNTATIEEEDTMTRDEMIAALKALPTDAIDVLALQAQVEAATAPDAALTALTQTLADSGLVQLSGDSISTTDVVNAVAQLAKSNVELSASVDGLLTDKATAEVHALVTTGFLTPAQEAPMLALKLSNEELFTQLVPDKPLIKLSDEQGLTPPDQTPEFDVDAEIERALALGAERGYLKKTAKTPTA